jgi:hypothetical protein
VTSAFLECPEAWGYFRKNMEQLNDNQSTNGR